MQLLASVAANLGQHAVGHCVAMSSYILPQLQHTEHREDNQEITLSETQGSWFGMNDQINHNLIINEVYHMFD